MSTKTIQVVLLTFVIAISFTQVQMYIHNQKYSAHQVT